MLRIDVRPLLCAKDSGMPEGTRDAPVRIGLCQICIEEGNFIRVEEEQRG